MSYLEFGEGNISPCSFTFGRAFQCLPKLPFSWLSPVHHVKPANVKNSLYLGQAILTFWTWNYIACVSFLYMLILSIVFTITVTNLRKQWRLIFDTVIICSRLWLWIWFNSSILSLQLCSFNGCSLIQLKNK